jgi:hypothetical protein
MVRMRCDPDRQFWSGTAPRTWEYGFEESQLGIDSAAAEMKNILILLGYVPSQIAEVFHPDLVKDWGYDAENSAE